MLSCTTDKYDQLYARWRTDALGLPRWGSMTAYSSVLDLCGGTGGVAKAALAAGVKTVHLLDLNPRCSDDRVVQVRGRAENAPALLSRTFSLVVCRQALGYCDLSKLAPAVYEVMEPGGRFVFNNFLQPRWQWHWYRYGSDAARYLEVSGYWRDHVVHLQASPRLGVDLTHFRWHRHEAVVRAFAPWFDVEWVTKRRSVKYRCTKAAT